MVKCYGHKTQSQLYWHGHPYYSNSLLNSRRGFASLYCFDVLFILFEYWGIGCIPASHLKMGRWVDEWMEGRMDGWECWPCYNTLNWNILWRLRDLIGPLLSLAENVGLTSSAVRNKVYMETICGGARQGTWEVDLLATHSWFFLMIHDFPFWVLTCLLMCLG